MSFKETLAIALLSISMTLVANLIFHYLKNKFDWFNETKKFKREYYYSQLNELYLELYGVVAQSEFIRYFFEFDKQFSFMDLPFIELKNYINKIETDSDRETIIRQKTEVETELTRFNKNFLTKLIIEKRQYASPKLLKLAVAHRFCVEYYSKEDISDSSLLSKYQEEEIKLIYELVVTIIKETNEKLKYCRMDWIENEMEHGMMDYNIYGENVN